MKVDLNELKVNGFQLKTFFLSRDFLEVWKENQLNVDPNELKVNGIQLKTFFLSKGFLWYAKGTTIEQGFRWIENKWISIEHIFLSKKKGCVKEKSIDSKLISIESFT